MANRRRPQDPPPIEIKQFTPEEIQRGILKLGRRMEQVQDLRRDQVMHDDQRVDTAEHDIRDTILDVFGPNSPEYRTHQYHSLGATVAYVGMPDEEFQEAFEERTLKTITMLEGLIRRLKEKQAELGSDTTARVRTAFEGLDLHPRIASVCVDLYRNGHYRNAVQDASIALINYVKEKSRRHDLDGAGLMTTIFSKNAPILAFNELRDQTDRDEQEGWMHLFLGSVLALRNPRVHALPEDSPEQALEYIAFLSLLAKKVDQTRRVEA